MSIKSHHDSVVRVPLGKRSYPIYIGTGTLRHCGKYFKKHGIARNVIVITDTHVGSHYLSAVKKSLTASGFSVRSITIPPGEKQKSIGRVRKMYTTLLEWKIERESAIVALGGGVIGDLAGFIAATYQRGVEFIQIPTSLLAQVDSSVGGKVGINHPLAKNMIGSFYQPKFVFIDTDVLRTLPSRELVCGYGEVIKYGIIADKRFFDFTTRNRIRALSYDSATLRTIVRRCCRLKAFVVSKDERESGLRAILNFGHTVGHALERAGKYSYLKHGEAILYGMRAEAYIAEQIGKLSRRQREEIDKTVSALSLPSLSMLTATNSSLISTMKVDKKSREGKIRMALPVRIGKATLPQVVSAPVISRSLQFLRSHSR